MTFQIWATPVNSPHSAVNLKPTETFSLDASRRLLRNHLVSSGLSPAIAFLLVSLCPSCRLVPLASPRPRPSYLSTHQPQSVFSLTPLRGRVVSSNRKLEGSESPLTRSSTIALTLLERQTQWEEEILHILMECASCWWALPLRDFPQTFCFFFLFLFFTVRLADLGIIALVQTKD